MNLLSIQNFIRRTGLVGMAGPVLIVMFASCASGTLTPFIVGTSTRWSLSMSSRSSRG